MLLHTNIFTQEDIDLVLNEYWSVNSKESITVIPDGGKPTFVKHRTYSSEIFNRYFGEGTDTVQSGGNFIMTEFRTNELSVLWDKIKPITGGTVQMIRVVRYGQGGFAHKHKDDDDRSPANCSVVVMLSERSTYDGGILCVNDTPVDMQLGDIVVFDGESQHYVSQVDRGTRIVANFRLIV